MLCYVMFSYVVVCECFFFKVEIFLIKQNNSICKYIRVLIIDRFFKPAMTSGVEIVTSSNPNLLLVDSRDTGSTVLCTLQ